MARTVSGDMHMLLARNEEFIILPVIFAFVYLLARLKAQSTQNQDRMHALRAALDSPSLDHETKRQLVAALSNREDPNSPWALIKRNVIFVAGWIGMFVGVGLMVTGHAYQFDNGVITLLVSFAVLSLPLALREIEDRRRRSTAPHDHP